MATLSYDAPASIDAPSMRQSGRELLSLALMDARNHSLHLLSHFEDVAAARMSTAPPDRDSEPPAWLAGHVGWFAEYWIGRNPQRALGPACPVDAMRLASIEPMADQWFNPAVTTPAERRDRPLPGFESIRAYLLDTLESTLELLDKTAEDDACLHFYRAALFHEDLRGEQWVKLAQSLGVPLKLPLPGGSQGLAPILVPAGRWQLGSQPGGFVFGAEKWAHDVPVPEFEIDAQPVSWGRFVEFVDDGGYDRPEFWRPEGWEWLQRESGQEGRRGPRHVVQIGSASGAVMQNLFGKPVRMSSSQSAMHVTWWEADAFARWAGRRLPAEVEWEMAACTAARRGFRWGDVTEWTAGTLRPWPGFEADAWSLHTDLDPQPWFARARVQRGASFATRARMKHPKYRGFAMPDRDDAFVGFRTCAV